MAKPGGNLFAEHIIILLGNPGAPDSLEAIRDKNRENRSGAPCNRVCEVSKFHRLFISWSLSVNFCYAPVAQLDRASAF